MTVSHLLLHIDEVEGKKFFLVVWRVVIGFSTSENVPMQVWMIWMVLVLRSRFDAGETKSGLFVSVV